MRSTGIAAMAAGLALALTSPALAGGANSLDEAKEMAAKSGKPILVDFFADW